MQERKPVRVNLKVKTNVSKIETTGFGREDGGCLGAPFLKVDLARFSELKTASRCLDLLDWP